MKIVTKHLGLSNKKDQPVCSDTDDIIVPKELHYLGPRRTVKKVRDLIIGTIYCDSIVVEKIERRCPFIGLDNSCNKGKIDKVLLSSGTD